MEIKAELKQPYSNTDRMNFIVKYNHGLSYEIRETDTALEAWGKSDEDYIKEREDQFNKDFFNTSLGYVRRKVSMATGETKDFLSDLLPTISMGIQMGNPVQIITYNKPDFTQEVIDWTSLQSIKAVTAEFIKECFIQLSNDFKPVQEKIEDNGTEQATDINSNSPVISDEVTDDNTTDNNKSDVQDELDVMTGKSNETGTDNV